MSSFVRGSTIFFSAVLLDATGAPATPSGANLYLVYPASAGAPKTRQTVVMTLAGNVVSAQWDSSVAADGIVRWSIKAAGSNAIVQDGELTLTANEANA